MLEKTARHPKLYRKVSCDFVGQIPGPFHSAKQRNLAKGVKSRFTSELKITSDNVDFKATKGVIELANNKIRVRLVDN